MPRMQAWWGLTATIAVVAGVAFVGLAVSAALRDQFYDGSRLSLRGESALTEAWPA